MKFAFLLFIGLSISGTATAAIRALTASEMAKFDGLTRRPSSLTPNGAVDPNGNSFGACVFQVDRMNLSVDATEVGAVCVKDQNKKLTGTHKGFKFTDLELRIAAQLRVGDSFMLGFGTDDEGRVDLKLIRSVIFVPPGAP